MSDDGKGRPEEFLKGFPWKFQVEFHGISGIHEIEKGKFARIALTQDKGFGMSTMGTFVGLEVEIVDSCKGPIDKQLFPFNDYLTSIPNTKAETAIDRDRLQVISHCGWKWYINQPKSMEPIVDGVERYIGLFRGGRDAAKQEDGRTVDEGRGSRADSRRKR